MTTLGVSEHHFTFLCLQQPCGDVGKLLGHQREGGSTETPTGVGTEVPAGFGDVAVQLRAVWLRTELGQGFPQGQEGLEGPVLSWEMTQSTGKV